MRVPPRIKALLRQDGFARGAMTLMAGTAIAQAIPIAISPILTRLFTPTDYGVFALYAALVAFLAAAATGRYELAVMLPEGEEDADALVVLSAIIALGFGALLLVVALFARGPIASMLGHPEIAPWLLLLPVSVAAMGCYNALNYWLNRHRRYGRMSRNRMLQSGLGSGLQLSMGAAAMGAVGLIVGQFIGVIVTTVQIAVSFRRDFRRDGPRNIVRQMKRLARRYSNHPKHVLPAQWIGAAALQLPVLAVSGLYGAATVGFYAFAYRLMALPTTLIANAIGDVYRQRAAVAYRDHGDFRKLFFVTLGSSAALAIVPVAVVFVIAPELFALVFGESWRVAGEYARILSVATFFQFAFTPIDKGALIVGATRYIVVWHILRLTGFGATLAAAWAFHLSIERTLILFVLVNVVMYAVEGVAGYHFAGKDRNRGTEPS